MTDPSKVGTPVQHERTRYGESSRILREGNLQNYLPIISREEILEATLKDQNLNSTEREAIANFFQSISTEAKLTSEILTEFNKYDDKTREKLANYFKVVYKDIPLKNNKNEIVLNNDDEIYGVFDSTKNKYYSSRLKSYKISDLCKGFEEKNSDKENRPKFNFINSNEKPSKREPHYSAFMINNPDVRVGLKNSLEMSTFLNVVNTIEFSRAYPYFNAYFILPNKVNQNQQKPFKTASMNQFLFGGSLTGDKASAVAQSFESKVIKRRKRYKTVDGEVLTSEEEVEGVEANMSLFTSPQTMINANEQKGHFSNIKAVIGSGNYDRKATPRDTMLPFMSLQNFEIDISPTRGLMSFKTGRMSLILHDKNRMVDIAPLIKPDLFGAFGAEIVVEYGWSHPDAKDESTKNKIGEFIDSSRCIEKYMIVNSSFTINNNGMVNIDLSVASKGPVLFKLVEILKSPKYTRYHIASKKIMDLIEKDLNNISSILDIKKSKETTIVNISSNEIINSIDLNDINSIIDNKKSIISDSVIGKMRGFIDTFAGLVSNENKITISSYLSEGKGLKIAQSIFNKFFINNGWNLEDLISSPHGETQSLIPVFIDFQKHLSFLVSLYEEIIYDQSMAYKQTNILLESIIGGSDEIDPFFDKELAIDLKINSSAKTQNNYPEYVTLGSIITGIIGNYFLNGINNSIDEVQLIFYTANRLSGRMRRKNLASILVETESLIELLSTVSQKTRSVMTIESLIAKILVSIVRKKENISYGLKDIYLKKEGKQKKTDEQKKKERSILRSKEKELLRKIYPDGEDLMLILPNIVFSFDSLTCAKDNSYNTTICRITVYDRNDNPFNTLTPFIKNYTEYGDLQRTSKKIVDLKINKRDQKRKLIEKEYQKRRKSILEEAEKNNIIRYSKDRKSYDFFPNTDFSDIKNFIRKYIPYTKIGTQNSGIINASLSTINEPKLLTTYVSRPDRNNELIETRIRTDLPLRVMPSQAQVELYGCPWAQFGQMIFLDFGTETSVDNQYNIVGLSHQLSPGKFTTSLKLMYGDFYGPIENSVNNIIDLINDKLVEKIEERELKKQSLIEQINESETPVQLKIQKAYSRLLNSLGLYNFLKKSGFEPNKKLLDALNDRPIDNLEKDEAFINEHYEEIVKYGSYTPEEIAQDPTSLERLKLNKGYTKKLVINGKTIITFSVIDSKDSYFIKQPRGIPTASKSGGPAPQSQLSSPEFQIVKNKKNQPGNLLPLEGSPNNVYVAHVGIEKFTSVLLKYYLLFGHDKKIKISDKTRGFQEGEDIEIFIDTSSFYNSPIYNNGSEADLQGQERLNAFYSLAKKEFNHIFIGNGVLLLKYNSSLLKEEYGVFHYNLDSFGKSSTDIDAGLYKDSIKNNTPNSELEEYDHNSKIDMSLTDDKFFQISQWVDKTKNFDDIFEGTFKDWVKDVWNKNKSTLGVRGYKKGSYDYLPYEFKKFVGLESFVDEKFDIDSMKSKMIFKAEDRSIDIITSPTKSFVNLSGNNINNDSSDGRFINISQSIKNRIAELLNSKPPTGSQKKYINQTVLEAVYFFMQNGYTNVQSVGLVANFQVESTEKQLNHKKHGDRSKKDGEYKSYGIAQWRDKRRKEQWLKFRSYSIEKSSLQDQLEYVVYELNEGRESKANGKIKKYRPKKGTSLEDSNQHRQDVADQIAFIISTYYERTQRVKDKKQLNSSQVPLTRKLHTKYLLDYWLKIEQDLSNSAKDEERQVVPTSTFTPDKPVKDFGTPFAKEALEILFGKHFSVGKNSYLSKSSPNATLEKALEDIGVNSKLLEFLYRKITFDITQEILPDQDNQVSIINEINGHPSNATKFTQRVNAPLTKRYKNIKRKTIGGYKGWFLYETTRNIQKQHNTFEINYKYKYTKEENKEPYYEIDSNKNEFFKQLSKIESKIYYYLKYEIKNNTQKFSSGSRQVTSTYRLNPKIIWSEYSQMHDLRLLVDSKNSTGQDDLKIFYKSSDPNAPDDPFDPTMPNYLDFQVKIEIFNKDFKNKIFELNDDANKQINENIIYTYDPRSKALLVEENYITNYLINYLFKIKYYGSSNDELKEKVTKIDKSKNYHSAAPLPPPVFIMKK